MCVYIHAVASYFFRGPSSTTMRGGAWPRQGKPGSNALSLPPLSQAGLGLGALSDLLPPPAAVDAAPNELVASSLSSSYFPFENLGFKQMPRLLCVRMILPARQQHRRKAGARQLKG